MEGNESEQGMLTMTGVVALIRPELRRLLWGYRIPPASVVDLLERALLAAVETGDEGTDKEDWLLKAVELECCAYWRGAASGGGPAGGEAARRWWRGRLGGRPRPAAGDAPAARRTFGRVAWWVCPARRQDAGAREAMTVPVTIKPIYTPAYRQLLAGLREARAAAGLTQAEVAGCFGRQQSFVSKCESGERRIDPTELTAFARLYRKPVTSFLDEPTEPTGIPPADGSSGTG